MMRYVKHRIKLALLVALLLLLVLVNCSVVYYDYSDRYRLVSREVWHHGTTIAVLALAGERRALELCRLILVEER